MNRSDRRPGYAWHALGGHLDGSRAFWGTAGVDVRGGYRLLDNGPHRRRSNPRTG
ncbi:hypothetical protein [Salinispora sp. H7-4]|uniref:hypothetical protein n=1 Tax=Salinispora sp. H7-4 TaxID=2748321 RepID=UPI001C5555E8|nr:hypothetical protein [Salinispora sp. H7-4]